MIIIENKNLQTKPADYKQLGFGKVFTDYMIMSKYQNGKWQEIIIQPFQNLSLHPAATCLHYAQEVFEGLKAYRGDDGVIRLFRHRDNIKRLNESCRRMCIPEVDEDALEKAIIEIIKLEASWIFEDEDTALYIRPAIFGTGNELGVHPSKEYILCVILSPVAKYYQSKEDYVKIKIEEHFHRVGKLGTGTAKTGGNYASSLLSSVIAEEEGFDQVCWLDAETSKYIEEVGSMNIFFVIKGVLVTPMLNTSILDGITRRSIITLAKQMGISVEERKVSIDEVFTAEQRGELTEVFGSGTAAVISKVGMLKKAEQEIILPRLKDGVADILLSQLKGIQYGRIHEDYGWITTIQE
ncbi:MAG: branched-chain amino acid aminotransferase [Anaerorhabdus sp.]|uniref:branched-chain amino acid aminotransferase n=1 Tax=Anaerorhabdus sp. TaxID=1872524 RepID=UPI003A889972